MENLTSINFKSNRVIDFAEYEKNINHASKRSCKVLKFSSVITLDQVLLSIYALNPKDYPHLLLFVIETNDFDNINAEEIKVINFTKFAAKRPIILQVISNNGSETKWIYKKEGANQFVDLNEEISDHEYLFKIFKCFTQRKTSKFEKFLKTFIANFSSLKESSAILRFLSTLDIFDELARELIPLCALQGSKSDILAVLDASFEDDGRILSINAQNILSETFTVENRETSVLSLAVQNPNKEIVHYLISNCTHLIQQLSFDHRVSVSTSANDLRKFGILYDLIKCSDFPFPIDFDGSLVTDTRLLKIKSERREFYNAIRDRDENQIDKFIMDNWNLKLVFSTDNRTALFVAAESTNFETFVKLKSLGFKAEEFITIDEIPGLSDQEKKEIEGNIKAQTRKNAVDAKPDGENTVKVLCTRSCIHNRMTDKTVEDNYREKIKMMFKAIYNIPMCSKFLDAASQCEDLKIIFDFESESVENVDIKSGPYASGTTYPLSKWIFIGAKETDENPRNKIEGVLIHEICHYVMRLVYENNEKPYYKHDKINEQEFEKISVAINMWTLNDNMSVNSSESSDENSIEDADDGCEGIISSVYINYKEEDYHPELIVRPLQILARYSGDEHKITTLKNKYKKLFNFISKFIEPELSKFNLRNRQEIRKINRTIGMWSKIKSEKLQLNFVKKIVEVMDNNIIGIISNISTLALQNILQYIENDNLPDTSNVFITSKSCENKDLLEDLTLIVQKNKNLKLIVDCSQEFNQAIIKVFKIDFKMILFIISKEQCVKLKNLIQGQNLDYEEKVTEVNFTFDDLTTESQSNLLGRKVKFQENAKLSIKQLFEDFTNDINQYKNIIDENLLKMLTENTQVLINVNSKDEIYDLNFEVLFQPRKLIKSSDADKVVLQEQVLATIKGMKSILISDFGGTGKSWILKKIARSIRRENSKNWVTYIDLKLHVKVFEEHKKITEFSEFMVKNIMDLKNEFEEEIFKFLYKNGKVVVLFDGFDEIPQECADIVIAWIKTFEHSKGNKLWIATRNYCENDLQQKIKFDVVFKLEDFSEENGMDLIAQTWLLNEKCRNKTEINIKADLKSDPNYSRYKKIVKKLESKLPKKTGRPIGFPLFYNMIANIYTNKSDSIDILNMFLIFDAFVKQQCNRWMSEKGQPGLDAAIKSQDRSHGYFEIHQLLALRSLFPKIKKFCNLDYDELSWLDKEINACGLVTKSGDVYVFQHECFREFFVVQYILRILTEKSKYINQDFLDILNDTLSNKKCVVLRMFLNDALAPGTEKYNKVRETLSSSENYSKSVKNEEVLMRICKESHENLIKICIELSNKSDHKIVKVTLNKTIESIIDVAKNNETVVNIFKTITSFLKQEDLKELILDREVIQSIINLRSDIAILEDISQILQIKTDKNFIKECLTWRSYANRNAFYFLCKSEHFNENNFELLLKVLQRYLNSSETVKMIKECDDSMKNILHICVEMMNEEKLTIMWNEIQQFCDNSNSQLNFKDLVIQNESSVLHVATLSDNESFHSNLWKLLLQTYPKINELKKLAFHLNKDGQSFLHLLVKNSNHKILCCALEKLDKIPFKDILQLKDSFGKNLLHLSICVCKNDLRIHETLWINFEKSIKSNVEIMDILKDTDSEHNNIIQLVTRYSTSKVFIYIIQTLRTMISSDDIKIILKKHNKEDQNLIQIAVIYNFDLEFHEHLWKIINNYFETSEILEIINSTDTSENNILFSAVLYSKKSIVELTWNEIRKFICEKVDQNKYLNLKGQEEKSLIEVAQNNKENLEVATWVDKLLKEFLPKEVINDHPYGKPENLLRFEADNQITIECEKLQRMLEHHDVCVRKIVAFSVIGAFRKGKSYFLNYCLRYLYAHYPSINYPENLTATPNEWIGEENEPLKGFSWRSGSTRDTIGITIWNDVFLHTTENDEKLAILVLDTQGLFDNDTSPQDNSRIFAIGTLISSIQVLNISMQIQEDHLQYLQFATDFAKFASNDSQEGSEKCFQNLIFLIRDWPHPDEYDNGAEDGEKYLQNCLKIKENQNKELKSVRMHIHKSFDKLNCILLPPPGNNVAIGRRKGMKYDGNHSEMDLEFKKHFSNLIKNIFCSEKLITKKIQGKCLTAIEYLQYVEKYLEIFKSENLPKTQSIYESTVQQQLCSVIESCLEEYQNDVRINQQLINKNEQVEIIHKLGTFQALFKYNESNKMGNHEHHTKFRAILLSKIKNEYENWKKPINEKITSKLLEDQKKIEQMKNELSNLRLEKDKLQRELARQKEISKKLSNDLSKSNDETNEAKQLKVELEIILKQNDEEMIMLNRKMEEEKNKLEKGEKEFKDVINAMELKYNESVIEIQTLETASKQLQEEKDEKILYLNQQLLSCKTEVCKLKQNFF